MFELLQIAWNIFRRPQQGPRHKPRVQTPQLESAMLTFARFLKDQSGATAIEYGLIAAGISIAIIAVVQGLGTQLKTTFSSVSSALK